MKTYRAILFLIPTLVLAQGLDPKALTLYRQPPNIWPTYNGDYSGRRFSELTQINDSNINLVKIEWIYRIAGIGPQRGVGNPTIKSTPLMSTESSTSRFPITCSR